MPSPRLPLEFDSSSTFNNPPTGGTLLPFPATGPLGSRLAFGCAVLAFLVALSVCSPSGFARDLKFHGPFVQWHDDPTTSATITWVERVAPDQQPLPVWRAGRAGFGYGDSDDGTEVPEMKGAFPRLYLANYFHLSSATATGKLQLVIRYDDAFVAWINGEEVARSANISGQHAYADVKYDHEAGDEGEVFVIENPERFLVKGKNLITIEGHNVKAGSSDFTLDPMLVMGNQAIIPEEEEWLYLTGADPSTRWFLKEPSLSPLPQLPRSEKSDWSLGIRPRGSALAFQPVKHEEQELAETGNPVFHAKAEGLRPDTAYEFLLSVDGRRARTGWFRTAPAVLNRPLKFIAGGDMGTTTAVPICKRVGREDPLFVLVGGDLAYANGRAAYRWYDWIDNWSELVVGKDGRSLPIIAGIGNHEMKSFHGLSKWQAWRGLAALTPKKENAPFYFSLFDLPGNESNFSVDFGDYLSIILLDSNHAQRVKKQTRWLEGELKDRVSVRHLFPVYHRPAWGTGIKANQTDIQEEWCPLFEEYQVDCVFENDHHAYKRSHPLTAGMRDDRDGILYLGDGAWGARLRPITDRMLNRVGARSYLAKWRSVHHVFRVTLLPDGSRSYEAIESDGRVFDSLRDRKDRRSKRPDPGPAIGRVLEKLLPE